MGGMVKLKKPKMILFDYGQTLVNQQKMNGIKGSEEVLKYAVENKSGITAEQLQEKANRLNKEIGRLDPKEKHLVKIEMASKPFNRYLYESNGITLSIPYEEVENVFWDVAAPGVPTEGIADFLQFLKEQGIRFGVISNISFSEAALRRRLKNTLPEIEFEMVIASSEYMFRKPNKEIFELALLKADLKPDEVWYIGDEYQSDCVGATNAGIFPIWYLGALDFEQDLKQDVLKIHHWNELKEMMGGK